MTEEELSECFVSLFGLGEEEEQSETQTSEYKGVYQLLMSIIIILIIRIIIIHAVDVVVILYFFCNWF